MIRVLGGVLQMFAAFLDVFAGAFHRMAAGISEKAKEHEHAER